MNVQQISRRQFLKATGVTGAGLILGISLSGCSEKAPAVKPVAGAFIPDAFIQVTPDNRIIFYCPRDEIGQGVTTGLTTLVAEELDVNPAAIEIRLPGVHADYNNPELVCRLPEAVHRFPRILPRCARRVPMRAPFCWRQQPASWA